MKIRNINNLLIVTISFVVLITASPIYAATINFTGAIGFVEYDSGSSIYSGVAIGDTFSGSFTYGNSVSDASSEDIVAPTATHYNFTGIPYGGLISDGTIKAVGENSIVGIGDNDGMGDDTLFINNLYGTSIPYATISDVWDVSSSNDTQAFGLALYSLDTNLFSGTDFQPIPPTLDNIDISLFYIEELDASGNSIYLATGILSSVTVVPVPAAMWLFGSGLIGLLGFMRNKAT